MTELMLNHLIEGMRDAGAEVEVVNLRDKSVRNCTGCLTCFTKTPGACVQKDDMTKDLFPKWRESDLAVYATPLYSYGMNASLKAFIERTLPSIEPFFEFHEGRMFHPVRHKYPPVVMLSVSGMPGKEHFGALSAHVKYLFGSPGRKLAAEIYRPAAEIMTNPFFKEKADDVLGATVRAGRELVGSMAVSPETMARITQPLVDPQFFATTANVMWKTCISEGVTVKEFADKNMVPRPDSLESFLLLFPLGLNTKAVGEKKVALQFKFSGEVQGSCHFAIDKGAVGAQVGTCNSPDLTIEAPFNVWMDIMTGKADGRQMLMDQKYKVSGDLSLMMKLFQKA